MNFSRCIARSLGHNLVVALALAAVLLLGLSTQEKGSVVRPAADGSARALVKAYDCGSNVPDPTHAVVTIDGVTRYVGQRMADRAIEQAVFGVDHGLVVHGFCS